jgi:rhamnosyltransferase
MIMKQNNRKILGVVVLYYPDKDVKDNLFSYINATDALMIWDNTPGGSGTIIAENPKIIRMGMNENMGIGKALNEAVKYAMANDFTYLLTMDQDSRFEAGHDKKYIDIITQTDQEAIFGPNYIIHGQTLFKVEDSFINAESTMTSGSLFPVNIFKRIGLFREDFFIDAIDHEFCLRARQNKIRILIIPQVLLFHQAGYQKKKHKFLWKTFFPNEYSPVRSYYIIRNGLVTQKLYPWSKNFWKGFLFYWFYKRIFFVLCYEDNKYKKLKGLLLGYLHGKIGKTGKQTIFDSDVLRKP